MILSATPTEAGASDQDEKSHPLCHYYCGCIDANDVMTGIEKLTAGIAGIKGGCVLDDVFYQATFPASEGLTLFML
jgi:hypothetical protein